MKHISDDILIKALKLRDEGKTPAEIFATFPEAKEELAAYFALAADLKAVGETIVPPRELLAGALRRAAAERELAARPASATMLGRIAVVARILVPAFAVALIVILTDRSPVSAPAPVVPDAGPGPAGLTGPVSGPSPIALNPANPAANHPPQASNLSTGGAGSGASTQQPMMMTKYSGAQPASQSMAAPQSPSAAADQVANAYMAGADAEQSNFSDTSAAQTAAQQNDSQSARDVGAPTN